MGMLATEEGLRGMTENGNTVTQAGAGTEQGLGQMEGIHQPCIAAEGVKGAWKVNLPDATRSGRTHVYWPIR
jgi:hypothetical protein